MTVANRSSFVDVRGRKTQLLTGGQGPPLLYLHSAAGETDWTRWHEALAEQFTVYAPAKDDATDSAYAIPRDVTRRGLGDDLDELHATFQRQNAHARVEFLVEMCDPCDADQFAPRARRQLCLSRHYRAGGAG